MDVIDLVIIVYVLLAALWGYRRGLAFTLLSLAGLIVGLLIGSWLGATVPTLFPQLGATWRSVLAVVLLLLGALGGNAVGAAIGFRLRVSAHRIHLGIADATTGAALGVLVALAVTWYIGLVFSTVPWQPLAAQIRDSTILQQLYRRFPDGGGWVADLQQVLSAVPFPEVFANLEPPLPGAVPLPASVSSDTGVRTAAAETVKVVSVGCGGLIEGSGFPVASNLILTNAHVVAGGRDTTVQVPGRFGVQAARVVYFNPSVDLALLRVSGLDLTPLTFATGAGRGSQGAVIGYPNGGSEKVVPAAVRGVIEAQGRNIYSQGLVNRQIFSLQASVIPGNSGGPFVDLQGKVDGVVFAKSLVIPEEGFALSASEVLPYLAQAERSDTTVSTQACVA